MRKIALFVEDYQHDSFIRALITRLAVEYGFRILITPYNAIGGYGQVIDDFVRYLRDLRNDRANYYDLLIVATDSNCKGYAARKKEISEKAEEFENNVVCAIPDPHIERWMLLDQCAFKKTFGSACNTPDYKCEQDRYKRILGEEIRKTNTVTNFNGFEYSDEIIGFMDLRSMEDRDESLGKLIKDLKRKFNEWRR